jgi:hypothetical protein
MIWLLDDVQFVALYQHVYCSFAFGGRDMLVLTFGYLAMIWNGVHLSSVFEL